MIQIGFLWHMHQPLYVDPTSGVSVLPWVRLHATRAYYDMIRLAADYPDVHCTYNLVPVLVEQLERLVAGGSDAYRDLAARPADSLTEHEAEFLVEHFFQANWTTLVRANPGYARLLELREREFYRPEVVRNFTVDDLRDLQVWFNLAWFGFTAFREYPELRALREQQQGFSEADKATVFRIQDEILARVLGLYAQAAEAGIVELSTTPYYHPILPLLCDSMAGGRALPQCRLIQPPFRHPEDALAQLERAVAQHTRVFGKAPRGVWPSEGSVSPELVPLLARAGFDWFATSEGILHRSTLDPSSQPPPRDFHGNPSVLMPYEVEGRALFFRQLELSDLVGFAYSHMFGPHAAGDLIERIRRVAQDWAGPGGRPALVPIILDGENPWEHYPDGGEGFLRNLFEGIRDAEDLQAVTFSEHLAEYPPVTRIEGLWSGSWIHSNFGIWMGHAEDQAAWELLRDARDFLDTAASSGQHSEATLNAARESLYAAEGSDWFWWYGEEFSSQVDYEFDRLFRAHVSAAYERLGSSPPRALTLPIKGMRRQLPLPSPRAIVRPHLDGRLTTYYEWADAAEVVLVAGGGAMARGAPLLRRMGYGADEQHLFIRLDPGPGLRELRDGEPGLELVITRPTRCLLHIPFDLRQRQTLRLASLTGEQLGESSPGHTPLHLQVEAAFEEVLELAIPRALLGLEEGGWIEFFWMVVAHGGEVMRYPTREVFQLEIPAWDRLQTKGVHAAW